MEHGGGGITQGEAAWRGALLPSVAPGLPLYPFAVPLVLPMSVPSWLCTLHTRVLTIRTMAVAVLRCVGPYSFRDSASAAVAILAASDRLRRKRYASAISLIRVHMPGPCTPSQPWTFSISRPLRQFLSTSPSFLKCTAAWSSWATHALYSSVSVLGGLDLSQMVHARPAALRAACASPNPFKMYASSAHAAAAPPTHSCFLAANVSTARCANDLAICRLPVAAKRLASRIRSSSSEVLLGGAEVAARGDCPSCSGVISEAIVDSATSLNIGFVTVALGLEASGSAPIIAEANMLM